MVERKRIGLVFSYNENWIAGAYYILNIVHALNTIDDSKKPKLVILSNSLENYNSLKLETNYPYLEFVKFPFDKAKYNLFERIGNKISRILFRKQLIVKTVKKPKLHFLYPKQINSLSNNIKKVNWIPDFQEDYLPHFFKEAEIRKRKKQQKEIFSIGDIVVLSSEDAKSDFIRLYPDAKAQPFVLSFAVTHPDYSKENISELLKKYDLPINYFFAPNQFWAHKNHIVILKAVKLLRDNGVKIVVALSGKENDYRNADNFNQLKNYISEHNLQEQIKFLGFLPRTEQLCLFKHAQAIIQPSLFEGWSTVVEDAKALGKFCIVSNLNVHKEQLKENAYFFDPQDYKDLAEKIQTYLSSSPKTTELNYNISIFEFANRFYQLTQMAID